MMPTPKPPTRAGTYPTKHSCRVCKEGKIVEVFTFQTRHETIMRGSTILKRISVHCALCGVAYGKLPTEAPYIPIDGTDGVVQAEHVEGRAVDMTAENRGDVRAAPGGAYRLRSKPPSKLTECEFVDRIEHIFDGLGEGQLAAEVASALFAYVATNLGNVQGHGLEGLVRRGKA